MRMIGGRGFGRIVVALSMAPAVFGACGDVVSRPSEGPVGIEAVGIAPSGRLAQRHSRPHESRSRALTAEIPEFSGYVMLPDGTVEVLVTHMRAEAAARSAVLSLLRERRGGQANTAPDPTTTVRVVDYGFAMLQDWRDLISDELWLPERSGVVTVDLSESRNRIAVGVLPEVGPGEARAAIAKLGVPLRAVVFEDGSYATVDRSRAPLKLTSRWDTIMAGIRHRYVDAIGPAVCTLVPLTSGGFLTSSHCTANAFAPDGALIWQNGTISADIIGNEINDPAAGILKGSQVRVWLSEDATISDSCPASAMADVVEIVS
jgi:hypothetical protein